MVKIRLTQTGTKKVKIRLIAIEEGKGVTECNRNSGSYDPTVKPPKS